MVSMKKILTTSALMMAIPMTFASFSEAQTKDIQHIVESYIMDNPEILAKAS